MKTAQQSQEKYLKKSIMAYLEGQPASTENWILGVLKGYSPEMVGSILNSLGSYRNSDKLAVLMAKL